jgi:hypothetical protein
MIILKYSYWRNALAYFVLTNSTVDGVEGKLLGCYSSSGKSLVVKPVIDLKIVSTDWGQCYKTFYDRNLRIFVIS